MNDDEDRKRDPGSTPQHQKGPNPTRHNGRMQDRASGSWELLKTAISVGWILLSLLWTPRKSRAGVRGEMGEIGQTTDASRPSAAKPACAECEAEKTRRGAGESWAVGGEDNPVRHEAIGSFLVFILFIVALLGGIAFVVGYWTGASNQWLGCWLALFLGGFGVTLAVWSHLLTSYKQVAEPREGLRSPSQERTEAAADFTMGEDEIRRRGLLKWMVAGAAATFGAIVVSLFRSLGPTPDKSLYSTVWDRGQRLMNQDGKPVLVNDLRPGSTMIVFPEGSIGSEKAQTVLVRVEQHLLELPEDRADWAPMGNLAFSRVCTHAGCAVGMYEATTHQLMCPCHQSTFDVLRACQPTGGPAARALPQLPLYADADGTLRAGGGFSHVPGPGFWGIS